MSETMSETMSASSYGMLYRLVTVVKPQQALAGFLFQELSDVLFVKHTKIIAIVTEG